LSIVYKLLFFFLYIYNVRTCLEKFYVVLQENFSINIFRRLFLNEQHFYRFSRFRGRDKYCRPRSVRFNSASFSFRFESIYFLKISIRNRFGMVFVLINHLNYRENYLLKRIIATTYCQSLSTIDNISRYYLH
jgi:hypothetical protein